MDDKLINKDKRKVTEAKLSRANIGKIPGHGTEKYKFDLDMATLNSLSIIANSIKNGATVLEFGPAYGRLTKYLKESLNCKVYIVEIDVIACNEASCYSEGSFIGDIENYGWLAAFKDMKFDHIVFADVLEHLKDPQKVLLEAKNFLKHDGSILLSVPNVGHNSVTIDLLNNKFNYNNLGILDSTHLRFFTLYSLEKLLNECHLFIENKYATYAALGTSEIKNDENSVEGISPFYWKTRNYGEVYQFIYEVRKASEFVKKSNNYIVKNKPLYNIQLFLDYGKGCSGDPDMQKLINLGNRGIDIAFDLNVRGEYLKCIRADLLDKPCAVTVKAIRGVTDAGEVRPLEIASSNANLVEGNKYYFTHDDPQIYLMLGEKDTLKALEFVLDYDWVEDRNLDWIVEEIKDFVRNIGEKNVQIAVLESELHEERTRGQGEILRLGEELATGQSEVLRLGEELATNQSEVLRLQEELLISRNEVFSLGEELATSQNKTGRLREELAINQAETVRLNDDYVLFQTEHELLKSDLLLSQTDASLFQSELESTRSALRSLQREFSFKEEELLSTRRSFNSAEFKLRVAQEALTATQDTLKAFSNATFWRMTKPFRLVCDCIKFLMGKDRKSLFSSKAGIENQPENADHSRYQEWIGLYDTLSDQERTEIRNNIAKIPSPPLISIVMPAYNTPIPILKEAIDSVIKQLYPYWELCIADDASTNPAIQALLREYSEGDKRIKLCFRQKNGHISAASNSALDMATGEFVALLDHDDVLPENALYEVALAIRANPEICMIYSDEDKLDLQGRRCDPYFKSDWNPDLFLSHNMFSHLGVYKRTLLNAIGGFRIGLEGSQDYDVALRCWESVGSDAIHHIPKVLYHWRIMPGSAALGPDEKPYAIIAAIKAVGEHLKRKGIDAEVRECVPGMGMLRVKYYLPEKLPKVSIIIPTRDAPGLLKQCVESLRKKTTYPSYEIILVDNGTVDVEALCYIDHLKDIPNISVIKDEGPFNYSRLNNKAVGMCRGEVLCLLNNDTEVISCDWLEEMVSHAIRPEIGVVGARLWYPDNTLQHGGIVLGLAGSAAHAHHRLSKNDPGYFGRAWLIQNYSAVTAACWVVRKVLYESVGGLDECHLAVTFSDVDFCIRVRDSGYRNLWTPFAELYHHESATRGYDSTPEKQKRFEQEIGIMKERYRESLFKDPAYSPNLDLSQRSFALAFPPRR